MHNVNTLIPITRHRLTGRRIIRSSRASIAATSLLSVPALPVCPAVGAGVCMSNGETLTGVLDNDIVEEHPDTGDLISGLAIPHWDFILQSAARGFEVTGLGYRQRAAN